MTYWWLNGYVGFDASQKPWAKQRIDALFAWHRRTQLKHYVALLTGAQRRLQHDVTKQQMLDDYEELIQCGDRIVDEIAARSGRSGLVDEGREPGTFRHKFESNNEKYRKDHLRGDLQDKQKSRYKDVMEWAEYWFGDFSDEQEAVIRRASDQRPLNNELWAADRVVRQQSLIALVQRSSKKECRARSQRKRSRAISATITCSCRRCPRNEDVLRSVERRRSAVGRDNRQYRDAETKGARHRQVVALD